MSFTDINYFQGLSFLKYKQVAGPVRILLSIIIGLQFFGIYQFPQQVLYIAAIFSITHLTSIAIEKAKLSTVEIGEKKCPSCNLPMYSKVIKCEKCKMQLDTDDKKD